jgi:hypothetical protein
MIAQENGPFMVIFLSFQNMPTGSIEVVLKEFKIISPAKKQLPFVIRDFSKVSNLFDNYTLESIVVNEQSLKISMLN